MCIRDRAEVVLLGQRLVAVEEVSVGVVVLAHGEVAVQARRAAEDVREAHRQAQRAAAPGGVAEGGPGPGGTADPVAAADGLGHVLDEPGLRPRAAGDVHALGVPGRDDRRAGHHQDGRRHLAGALQLHRGLGEGELVEQVQRGARVAGDGQQDGEADQGELRVEVLGRQVDEHLVGEARLLAADPDRLDLADLLGGALRQVGDGLQAALAGGLDQRVGDRGAALVVLVAGQRELGAAGAEQVVPGRVEPERVVHREREHGQDRDLNHRQQADPAEHRQRALPRQPGPDPQGGDEGRGAEREQRVHQRVAGQFHAVGLPVGDCRCRLHRLAVRQAGPPRLGCPGAREGAVGRGKSQATGALECGVHRT